MLDENRLGTVTWPDGETVATLMVDGSWSCPAAPWLEPALRDKYSASYRGPSEGPFGPAQLDALAADVRGTAVIDPRPEEPAGTVY